MNITQSHNRAHASIQKYNASRTGKTRGKTQSVDAHETVHFSFEANLLYELIDKYGYMDDPAPWYFPDAYLTNAESALKVSSDLVLRAQYFDLHIDLNYMFEEVKQLNGISMENSHYTCHTKELTAYMEKSAPTDFRPENILSMQDKRVLKLLHHYIASLGKNPSAWVEDFALLYAKEKSDEPLDQRDGIKLIPQTAKRVIDKYIDIVDPAFVPVLIDFYKAKAAEIRKSLSAQ